MEDFEKYLAEATAPGVNGVPGAVMAVVNKDGTYLYKAVAGTNGIAPNAPPLQETATFWLASCTKLITSIAALQLVSQGHITLDESLTTHLPELTSQPIVSQLPNGEFQLNKADTEKPITLRHLLIHSSGAVYDWDSALLTSWRASQGQVPQMVDNGNIVEGYSYPRVYEAGESWGYGPGLDWTSILIQRLTNLPFETYVEKNIARPLGIRSFTWHLPRKPDVAGRMMKFSTRRQDGVLVDGPTPFWPADPEGEGGGAGLYSSNGDFTRVLADLLKDDPILLPKSAVKKMFSPQFSPESGALKGLYAGSEKWYACAYDFDMDGVKVNLGLGGLLLMEDVQRDGFVQPRGTLSWSGLPALHWTVNRERGIATFFATQVVPWPDKKSFDLIARFETAVWRSF